MALDATSAIRTVPTPAATTDFSRTNNREENRIASQNLQQARRERQEAAQRTQEARAEEQQAQKRLEAAKTEERRAEEKVNEARAENRQAKQTDATSSGRMVNVVV